MGSWIPEQYYKNAVNKQRPWKIRGFLETWLISDQAQGIHRWTSGIELHQISRNLLKLLKGISKGLRNQVEKSPTGQKWDHLSIHNRKYRVLKYLICLKPWHITHTHTYISVITFTDPLQKIVNKPPQYFENW